MRLIDLDHFTEEAREMGFVAPAIDWMTADQLQAERMRDADATVVGTLPRMGRHLSSPR